MSTPPGSPPSPPPVPRSLPAGTAARVYDACLCLHAQRAARALARRFDEAFRPLAITSGQFSLLMAVSRPRPARLGVVAAALAMDRTTLTAALKPLARAGLVVVTVDPDDRRGRMIALTEAGASLLRRALPVWERTHAEAEALLDDADRDRLRDGLRSLAAAPAGRSPSPAPRPAGRGRAR